MYIANTMTNANAMMRDIKHAQMHLPGLNTQKLIPSCKILPNNYNFNTI